MSAAASFPLSTPPWRNLRIAPMPFSRSAGEISRTTVANPAWALTCAMPLPMSPQPTTPTLRIGMKRTPPRTFVRRDLVGAQDKGRVARQQEARAGARRRKARRGRAALARSTSHDGIARTIAAGQLHGRRARIGGIQTLEDITGLTARER